MTKTPLVVTRLDTPGFLFYILLIGLSVSGLWMSGYFILMAVPIYAVYLILKMYFHHEILVVDEGIHNSKNTIVPWKEIDSIRTTRIFPILVTIVATNEKNICSLPSSSPQYFEFIRYLCIKAGQAKVDYKTNEMASPVVQRNILRRQNYFYIGIFIAIAAIALFLYSL